MSQNGEGNRTGQYRAMILTTASDISSRLLRVISMLRYRLTLASLSRLKSWLTSSALEIGLRITAAWRSLRRSIPRRPRRFIEGADDVYAHATKGQALVIAIYEGQLRYLQEQNRELREEVKRLTELLAAPVIVEEQKTDKKLEPLSPTSRTLSSRAARLESVLRQRQKKERENAADLLHPRSGNVGVGREQSED